MLDYYPPGYRKVERVPFMGGLHPKFIEVLCNSATDYDVRFFKNSLFVSNFISSVQIFALTFGWF